MANQYLPCVLRSYTDSGFTNPHQLVLPDEPAEFAGQFTHMGAQAWGMETDRHIAFEVDEAAQCLYYNPEAYHELVIELVAPSLVRQISISTRWYTGNHVPIVSVDLIKPDQEAVCVLQRVDLQPDHERLFDVEETLAIACRVRCYHEGGIARINLFGESAGPVDSRSNLLQTARVSHVSNEHYGGPAQAIGGVRKEDHMIGWESARMGFGEQAVFHLASPSIVEELVVDTYMHRLNPPMTCHLFGLPATLAQAFDHHVGQLPRWALVRGNDTPVVPTALGSYMTEQRYREEPALGSGPIQIRLANSNDGAWIPLVGFQRLNPDCLHRFTDVKTHPPVSHLLFMFFPNGGLHGLRVHGREQLA